MPTTPEPYVELLKVPVYAAMVARVRNFIRDYEPINRLLHKQENSDRDMLFAISWAIDDINGTPPPIMKDLAQMVQSRWAPLVTLGAAIYLMRSVGMHYIRNDLPFNDGGVMTNGLSAKWPAIQSWLREIEAEYQNQKNRAKVAANLQEMMGHSPSGVPSEFAIVHGLERFYW
jgi:hypothetical protein